MPQNTTDPLAAMSLQRDPASGSWTYVPMTPPSLTADELDKMSKKELRSHLYTQGQDRYTDWVNAELGKQAQGLNYGEQALRATEEAFEGYGTEARRNLDRSYGQALSSIDPRLGGTTIARNQRMGVTRDYNQGVSDLERQIAQAKAGAMSAGYRNMQNLITGRADSGPDIGALNNLLLNAGAAGVGSSGPSTPEWWEGPLAGAIGNWATTPGGPDQGSPLSKTISSIFGMEGGWGDGQGGGGGLLGSLSDMLGFGRGGGAAPAPPELLARPLHQWTAADTGFQMPNLGGALTEPNWQMPNLISRANNSVAPTGGYGDLLSSFLPKMPSLGGLGGLGSLPSLSGLAGLALPVAGLAGAGVLAYKNWDDITRETGRIGEQVQDEVKRSGKKIEKEYKRGIKKAKKFFKKIF